MRGSQRLWLPGIHQQRRRCYFVQISNRLIFYVISIPKRPGIRIPLPVPKVKARCKHVFCNGLVYFYRAIKLVMSEALAQRNRERPTGRSRFRCWLQTAKIPSLFCGLDAEHQQFVDVLLMLTDLFPQSGNLPIQGRLEEGPLLVQSLKVCLFLTPACPEGFCIFRYLCI